MKKLVSAVVSCAIVGSILAVPVAGAQETRLDSLVITQNADGRPQVIGSCTGSRTGGDPNARLIQCKDAAINELAGLILKSDKIITEQEQRLQQQSERFSEIARLFETEQVYNRFLEGLIDDGIDLIDQLISQNQEQQQEIHVLKENLHKLQNDLNTSNKRIEDVETENQRIRDQLLEGLDIIDKQHELLEEQNTKIKRLIDQIQDLEHDNEALNADNETLRGNVQKALDALKKSLEENKELAEKNQALKNQLANAQSKIEELEKKYAEAQRDILGLKNDNKRLEDLNKKNLDKLGETEGKLNTASILATVFGVISAIAAIIGIGGFLKPIIDRFFHHR